MAAQGDMHVEEFRRRLANVLGTTTTSTIVRMLEDNGIVKEDRVEVNRLQGTFESLFQDAGILIINEIVKQPYVTKKRPSNIQD